MTYFPSYELSSIECIANIINLATCIPLIIFLPIEGFFIYTKGVHLYFKSLCFSLIFSVTLHVYGCLIMDIVYFFEIDISRYSKSSFLYLIFKIAKYFSTFGICISRVTLWMVCCERIVATINRKDYEQMTNRFIAVFIFFLPYVYGFNIENISIAWDFFSFNYTKFCLFFEILTIIMSISLYSISKKLRKMTFDNTLQLSEKYQLNENIRIVRFLLPMTVAFVLLNVVKHTIFVGFSHDKILLKYASLFKNPVFFIAYSYVLIRLVIKNFSEYQKRSSKITVVQQQQQQLDIFNKA